MLAPRFVIPSIRPERGLCGWPERSHQQNFCRRGRAAQYLSVQRRPHATESSRARERTLVPFHHCRV